MVLQFHEELTGRILKVAFAVQNTLGCGFLEKVYENALVVGLQKEGLSVGQQVPFRVNYLGAEVGEYYADLVVERAVVVEVKAADMNYAIYEAQVLNYLKASGLRVGLLLNFARPKLQYHRLMI